MPRLETLSLRTVLLLSFVWMALVLGPSAWAPTFSPGWLTSSINIITTDLGVPTLALATPPVALLTTWLVAKIAKSGG